MFSKFRRRKHDSVPHHDHLQDQVMDAEKTVEDSKPPELRPAEQGVNTLEDHIENLSDDPYFKLVQNTSEVSLDLVKDQISDFVDNCELVKSLMDKLAGLHPWLKVGVEVFKGVLNLELTRRANDQKVVALYVTMCDMMSTMRLLLKIADGKESQGETAEGRLRKRMDDKDSGVIACIKKCGEVSNSYNNRNLAVRIVTSPKWEARFARLADRFQEHKAGIQFDLQIFTSTAINTVSSDVVEIKQMVSVIEIAFRHLLSPEERDMKKFIERHGGMEAVMGDEAAMQKMLKISSKDSEGEDEDSDNTTDLMTVDEFQLEVRKDIEVILRENARAFENKFQLILIELGRIEDVVRRESDRTVEEIVTAMRSGPHGRLIDCDIYHIWTQNGWKASVKARYLVMALHDYFSQLAYATSSARDTTHTHTHGSHDMHDSPPTVSSSASREVYPNGHSDPHQSRSASVVKDAWALQFINVFRVQQLIEAIDDDISSFVTIEEINRFTAARPKNWTLPHWIAYSTIGVELAVNWYYRRIIRLLGKIENVACNVLPANRAIVNEFWESRCVRFIDTLLCGLHEPAAMDEIDWDHNQLFNRFRTYLNEREEAMTGMLRTVAFDLDDQTTLRLVTQAQQPEKYIMPLLTLLLRHALRIVKHASQEIIHESELQILERSILTARRAVRQRVAMLEAVHKLQNLDPINQREKFAYGLFTYVRRNKPPSAHCWVCQDCEYHLPEDDDLEVAGKKAEGNDNETAFSPPNDMSACGNVAAQVGHSDAPQNLPVSFERLTIAIQPRFQVVEDTAPMHDFQESIGHSTTAPPQMNNLDYVVDQATFTAFDDYDHRGHSLVSSLIGQWRGKIASGLLEPDLFAFEVDFVGADGQFTIFLLDTFTGTSSTRGVADGRKIAFSGKREDGVSIQFEGALNPSDDEIEGSWDTSTESGTFHVLRVPPDANFFRPSKQDLADKPARARWLWAINTILHRLRLERQRLEPKFIRHWRERRDQFLALATKWKLGDLDSRDAEDWRRILKTVDRHDLLYWELRWEYAERCNIIHQTVGCDGCMRTAITGGRNICVECSTKDWINESVDLCSQCVRTGIDRSGPLPGHDRSHHLLQLRIVTHRRRLFALFQTAQMVFDSIDGRDSTNDAIISESELVRAVSQRELTCVICEAFVAKPFWYCIECSPGTIVCLKCNETVERDRPWLFQRNSPAERTHGWAHSLVLIPSAGYGDTAIIAADHGMSHLERKFGEEVSRMNGRMDDLERSISNRLLGLESLLRGLASGQHKPT